VDRPVTTPGKSDHLICRTGWAVLVTIACAYFTYRSFVAIREREFAWQHNWWDTLTWLVWTALAAGAISEVRCWRERVLFALLFLTAAVGRTRRYKITSAAWKSVRKSKRATIRLNRHGANRN